MKESLTIEFSKEVDGKEYKFVIPYGVNYSQAMEATHFFSSLMMKKMEAALQQMMNPPKPEESKELPVEEMSEGELHEMLEAEQMEVVSLEQHMDETQEEA